MGEAKLIQHAMSLNSQLTQHLDGLELPSTERSRLAASSFSFVMDCQSAIVLLIKHDLHQPSFSLVRLIFEALMRGYWYLWCANEEQVMKHYNNPEGHTDKLDKLVNDLMNSPELNMQRYPALRTFVSHNLGKDKQRETAERAKSRSTWKAVNNCAHAGPRQLRNYQSEESIESSFNVEQVREVVQFSNCCTCWAALGVCELANLSSLANQIYDEFTEVILA